MNFLKIKLNDKNSNCMRLSKVLFCKINMYLIISKTVGSEPMIGNPFDTIILRCR